MKSVIVKDLCFEYEENIPTIQNVSFEINAGEYVAILGHNGSGKSTIAKLLIGLLEKKSGDIIVEGISLNEENLYDVRSHIGIVFQNPDNQFIGATVRDDIAFGLENKCVPQKDMEDIINYYAKEVNMYAFLDHEPSKLSGGQKQRVAIAGILAMQPDILILDESTSMLDPKGKTEVNALVKKIRQEKKMTVLSITHDIEEASKADRIILLNKGRIEAIGSPKEILSDANKLEELGLEAPFSFQLSKQLQKIGIDVSLYIDEKELVEELCQLRLKK
jgi:ABC-type cobalt transport system, ATPase component